MWNLWNTEPTASLRFFIESASASLTSTFRAVGAFLLDNGSRDAALQTALPPGSYTAQVRGADGGTGEALIEIYEVP